MTAQSLRIRDRLLNAKGDICINVTITKDQGIALKTTEECKSPGMWRILWDLLSGYNIAISLIKVTASMATCQDHTSHNSSIDGIDDLQALTFIEDLLAVVRGWERKHFSSWP